MDLIIDIETVSEKKNFSELSEGLQEHWIHKTSFLKLSEEEMLDIDLTYKNRAAIYAEFGKIVSIGIGFIHQEDKTVRIKTISNDNEKQLLIDFFALVNKVEKDHKNNVNFCGHNIKEFDLPYICRRAIIQRLSLPQSLQLSGLKPWQINHQDTLEMWRFGDYKHYISLDLMAQVLQLPSSKTDINGADVSRVFWQENNLKRIAEYCSRDIFTTALVYLVLSNKPVDDFKAEYV